MMARGLSRRKDCLSTLPPDKANSCKITRVQLWTSRPRTTYMLVAASSVHWKIRVKAGYGMTPSRSRNAVYTVKFRDSVKQIHIASI